VSTPLSWIAPALVAAAFQATGVWNESAKLVSGDGEDGDLFGRCALSGTTLLVGACCDTNENGAGAGAAYVFERALGERGAWIEVAKLTASDGEAGDAFGHSVGISGSTAVVGAWLEAGASSSEGAAYVFDGVSGAEVAKLTAPVPELVGHFGDAVAISGDTIVVGASRIDAQGVKDAGAAYVFERDAGGPDAWGLVAELTSGAPEIYGEFGEFVAIGGDVIAVSSRREGAWAGAAYVFERDAGGANAWGLVAELAPAELTAGAQFGSSLATDGHRLAVGATVAALSGTAGGAAWLFERDTGGPGAWGEVTVLQASDEESYERFGISVALSEDRVLVGASYDASGFSLERTPGLAYDALTQTLYGTSDKELITISTATGEPTTVGSHGLQHLGCLAFDPNAGVLYGVDNLADTLVRIDPASASPTVIGPTGVDRVDGLTFDPLADELYGCDGTELLALDPVTGAATGIGPTGFTQVGGLAFDSATATLYGVDGATGQLLRIDPATGAGSALTSLGFQDLTSLAVDPDGDDLFAQADSSDSTLVEIDKVNGATKIFWYPYHGSAYLFERDLGGPNAWGESRKLMASDFAPGDELGSSVALSAGAAMVGSLNDLLPLGLKGSAAGHGSVYAFDLPHAAASYCTAGTSASGCQAHLSTGGSASASAASGFFVSATGVEGRKDGLFFFGTSGRQANPWGSGSSLQCVVPPVTRCGLLSGGGTTGLCDGTLTQDLNALWCPTCPKPQKNPGAGAVVQAQLWYRDPLNTSNQTTSLSDAIEFSVSP